jgi:hypothetical protein
MFSIEIFDNFQTAVYNTECRKHNSIVYIMKSVPKIIDHIVLLLTR